MDKAFEQGARLLGGHGAVLLLDRAHQAGIEPVELRVLSFPHPQAGLESREPPGEKSVLEDLEIALDCRSRGARIASDSGDVDDLGVSESGDREEADEARKIPHQRFAARADGVYLLVAGLPLRLK